MLKPTMGLEIHVQLKTSSKLFSSSPNLFGSDPNKNVSLFDIGIPGTLPVVNKKAIELAVLFGLKTNSIINKISRFERKHYFYPDSPIGYQITQMKMPILTGGFIEVEDGGIKKKFDIHHTHLETDAGKSVHFSGHSGVDYNRVSTPLVEIVSMPCIKSIDDAVLYAKEIYKIVTFFGICDGNMEEGSFRMDANISLSSTEELGTRCEIKNINSFKFLKEALLFEVERQKEILLSGGKVIQETRLYNSTKKETFSMRNKENAEDYRYFPEPDLPAIVVAEELIETMKKTYPNSISEIHDAIKANGSFDDKQMDYLMSNENFVSLVYKMINSNISGKEYLTRLLFLSGQEVMKKDGKTINDIKIEDYDLLMLLEKNKEGLSGAEVRSFLEDILAGAATKDVLLGEINKVVSEKQKALGEIGGFLSKLKTLPEFPDYEKKKDKMLKYFVGLGMKEFRGKVDAKQLEIKIAEFLEKA